MRPPRKTGPGQPFKSIQGCMDQAGYRFIGWDDGVVCDMGAVIKGHNPRPTARTRLLRAEELAGAQNLSHRSAVQGAAPRLNPPRSQFMPS